MNRALPLLLVVVVLLTGVSARAKNKLLEVSENNFVSLQWTVTGSFAGVYRSYILQNHEVIKPNISGGGGGGFNNGQRESPPQVTPMSENQWKELLDQLRKANVPTLAGNYKQPQLSDGFNETLILTISDDQNLDQTFVISNTGDKAPAPYYKFTTYLRALLNAKFPESRLRPVAPATPPADATTPKK